MITRRLLSVPLFCLFIFPVYSQEKDFGIWYDISLSRGITEKLTFEGGGSIRTFQFGSKVEQVFAEAGVDYEITRSFSAAASYRIANFSEIEYDGYYLQHKFFLDLKGKIDVSVIDFNVRMRLNTRIKTSEYDMDNNTTGRVRLKATYKTPSFPVNPYFYAETFTPLFRKSDRAISKYWLSGGIEININKKHSVVIAYLFDRDYIPDLNDLHILAMDYNIVFGKKKAVNPNKDLKTNSKNIQ